MEMEKTSWLGLLMGAASHVVWREMESRWMCCLGAGYQEELRTRWVGSGGVEWFAMTEVGFGSLLARGSRNRER